MIFNLTRQYRYLQRYRKIAELLIKNGLGGLVDWLDLGKYLPFKQRFNKEDQEINRKNLARRIPLLLQELGPTYIKLGQVLSTRADLLPPSYIKELRQLQDRVVSVPYEQIKTILESEWGIDYQRHFLKIEREPLAAASIAQTYRATLKDGTDVIIKVQRPGIEQIIQLDLEIIGNLAGLAEEKGLLPPLFNPSKIVEEFDHSLRKELNFKRELANIKRFSYNFREEKQIVVPRVYEKLSGRRILVLEEIKGIKLSEFKEVKRKDLNPPVLAALGARSLMKQVLVDGFFHADPHPGNVFIVGPDRLAYVDFGMMGHLTAEDQTRMSLLLIALLKQDVKIIVDLLLEIGQIEKEINLRKLKMAMEELLSRYYGIELAALEPMDIIDDIQQLLFKFQIRIPEEFFLLFRAIAVSEGVGLMLDPGFNLTEVATDFVEELIVSKLAPENLLASLIHRIWDFRRRSIDLPERLNNLLNKLVQDEFTIRFKHLNLDNLINKINIVSNRLSLSLIISALIISSSMILQTDMKPLVLGIPLLGFVGYSVAGLMGFWLIIAIFRSGRF